MENIKTRIEEIKKEAVKGYLELEVLTSLPNIVTKATHRPHELLVVAGIAVELQKIIVDIIHNSAITPAAMNEVLKKHQGSEFVAPVVSLLHNAFANASVKYGCNCGNCEPDDVNDNPVADVIEMLTKIKERAGVEVNVMRGSLSELLQHMAGEVAVKSAKDDKIVN